MISREQKYPPLDKTFCVSDNLEAGNGEKRNYLSPWQTPRTILPTRYTTSDKQTNSPSYY